MISWQLMIQTALGLFISADINMVSKSQYDQLKNTASLELFIALLIDHQSQIRNHPIRGPDAFALDYYQQSGGSRKTLPLFAGHLSIEINSPHSPSVRYVQQF